MYRKGLMDKQWDKVKGLVPGKATGGGVTAHGNRLFVDAGLGSPAKAFSLGRAIPAILSDLCLKMNLL